MRHGPKQKQRRVDVACGYALGAYIGVTLTWISVSLHLGLGLFALLIAIAAGFFGTLRTVVGLPFRLWITPVAALLYIKLLIIAIVYNSPLTALSAGICYTLTFAYPVYRLFKYDFAKTIPAWLCKNCGYPLMGLDVARCPECGERFSLKDVPKTKIT